MTGQAENVNKFERRRVIKMNVWPHKKRFQKDDLALSQKEGTVCQILIGNPGLQWPPNSEEQKNKKWYYINMLAPLVSLAMSKFISGSNDKGREQYQCE